MLLFFIISVSAAAADWAVTAAPVSFFPAGKHMPEGLYAQAGIRAALHPRLEAELLVIPRITPEPFSHAAAGAMAGFNLLADLEDAYFHMIADIGMLCRFDFRTQEKDPLVYVRISPLSIGNPDYRYRERIFTAGLLYDIQNQTFSWTFSTWIQDWFVSRFR